MRFLLLLLLFPAYCRSETYDTPPIVAETHEEKTIQQDQLFGYFTLINTVWDDGTPVTIVLMKNNSFAHNWFLDNYLGIGKVSYDRRVSNAVSSGRAKAPTIARDNLEMIDIVARTPGAVGYVDGAIITGDEGVVEVRVVQ